MKSEHWKLSFCDQEKDRDVWQFYSTLYWKFKQYSKAIKIKQKVRVCKGRNKALVTCRCFMYRKEKATDKFIGDK